MKIVLYHLTGNANVKALANGLAEANMLSKFYVSIGLFPGTMIHKLGSFKPFAELSRRKFDQILKPYTNFWPWLEVARMMSLKLGLTKLTSNEKSPLYIDSICRSMDRYVAHRLRYLSKRGTNAIYSYEDNSMSSFVRAKELGMRCFYDLPIGYWRTAHRLLEVERQRWPDWVSTITGLTDSAAKLSRKDEELKMADQIFVASSFTANTLKDYHGPLAPVHVIPYGFPAVSTQKRDYINKNSKRRLKILFVGSLSQRKGIADLIASVKELEKYVQLTLVGTKPTNSCNALNDALSKHLWIASLSHDEILKLMRENDILVFPSLFEGFGLVITEAMSQGTPVITTERTAGPDIINHNQNGWLIQAGSVSVLQEAIESLLIDRSLISKNGLEALETAKRRSWTVYGKEVAEVFRRIDWST